MWILFALHERHKSKMHNSTQTKKQIILKSHQNLSLSNPVHLLALDRHLNILSKLWFFFVSDIFHFSRPPKWLIHDGWLLTKKRIIGFTYSLFKSVNEKLSFLAGHPTWCELPTCEDTCWANFISATTDIKKDWPYK